MVNHINRKQLLKESLVITFLIILVTIGLQYFPLNFEVAKPIKEEFNDFDVYDIVYSGKATDNHTRDTNIIIFQVADTRREIAGQLKLLQKCKPAVIGVDVTFIGHKEDLETDSLLQQQLSMPNIVTGNRFIDSAGKQVLELSFFDAGSFKNSGYFNFAGDSIAVIRYYPPFKKTDNQLLYSFTSRIAEKYNQEAFSRLKKKSQTLQVINYRGNIESYTSFLNGRFDTAQLGDIIQGKIVLLGVLYKKNPLVLEDLHFTPLNERMNGKSFPDMYGVVIQANILSMILSNSYIISVLRIWSYVIGIILTSLLVHYQLRYYYTGKHPSDVLFFLLQFIIVIIIVYIFLFIYKALHYKVPLFPIVIPIVLCVEILEVYKFLVKRFLKRLKYTSVFLTNKH